MSDEQRDMFAKGAVELANIVAGALVFGQFVSEKPVQIWTFIYGIIVAFTFYLVAYRFSRVKRRR
jgi:hypothetical protein